MDDNTSGGNATARDFLARTISLFLGVQNTSPAAQVTIAEALQAVRTGTHPQQQNLAVRVQNIRQSSDKAKADAIKRGLAAVTFSGQFSARRVAALVGPSCVLVLDFDHVSDASMATFFAEAELSDRVLFAFRSPSGHGIKVGVVINGDHGRCWESARAHFLAAHGLEPDASGKDVSRLCFLSHDPAAYVATDDIELVPFRESDPGVMTNEATAAEVSRVARQMAQPMGGALRPGDAYNARATLDDVSNLLRAAGWTPAGPNPKGGTYWTRPGKARGVSGSLFDSRVFLPFTDSTELEANKALTPFALFAALNHGGNYTAAAADLRAQGFNDEPSTTDAPAPIAVRTHDDRMKDRYSPRPQLVAGMLPTDGVGALVAMPGEGKSLVAAELARCIAAGTPFHRHAVQTGRVLFACPDSPASTERRLLALPEPACRRVLTIADLPPLPASLGQIRATLEALKDDPVRLLVVDTFDSAREHQTEGGWQGQDGLVEAIVGGLRRVASDFQCAVLIAHHATRSDNGRARGSVVFDARCDFIGLVSQVGGDIRLDARKNRDGERGIIGAWRIAPVDVNGTSVPTLVDSDLATLANSPEDQQARLLGLIGDSPGISKRALASAADIPEGSIARHLKRLREGGFIQAEDNILTEAGQRAIKADPFMALQGVDHGVDHDPPVIQ